MGNITTLAGCVAGMFWENATLCRHVSFLRFGKGLFLIYLCTLEPVF